MIRRRLFSLIAAVAIVSLAAGCANKEILETARTAVAATAAVYEKANADLKDYNALPRCKAVPVPPCSYASDALNAAQKLQAARTSIDAARNMVNALPGQGAAVALPSLSPAQQEMLDTAAADAGVAQNAIKDAKRGS